MKSIVAVMAYSRIMLSLMAASGNCATLSAFNRGISGQSPQRVVMNHESVSTVMEGDLTQRTAGSGHPPARRWGVLLWLAAGLLFLFGGAKLLSVFGIAAILLAPEPIFNIRYKYFLFTSGLLEWGLALVILRFRRSHPNDCFLALIAFCTSAWLYRYALYQSNHRGPCPCLGTLTQAINISPGLANQLSIAVLILLSVGSTGGLLAYYISRGDRLLTRLGLLAFAAAPMVFANLGNAASNTGINGPADSIIRLDGRITWKNSTNGEPLAQKRVTKFSIVLDRCSFRLEETGQDPGLAAQSLFYDRTNWYHRLVPDSNQKITNITRFTDKGPISVPLKNPHKARSPATITVSPVLESLLPKLTSVLPVWLAFGSGCHFRDQTNQSIPPLYYMTDGQLHSAQRIRADRVMDSQGTFLNSYTDYWDEHLFPEQRRDCNGLTNIAFSITGWTNLGGTKYPSGFRFMRYFFSPSPKPRYWQSMDVSAFVDTAQVLASAGAVTPAILPDTYVIHHPSTSFEESSNPIGYRAGDGRLKTQAEVNAAAAQRQSRHSVQQPSNSGIRAAIILSAALVPLIFLVRLCRAKGNARKENK